MATAPPTDRRQSDFLEGAQFAVCLIIATAMAHSKKKKERLTDEASMFSFVCKPFLLFLLISRQSLVSVAGCLFKRVAGSGKVFGLNTLKAV